MSSSAARRARRSSRGYLERPGLAGQSRALPRMSGVSHLYVQHDAWCRIYQKAECNCAPDITLNTGSAIYEIDRKGRVRKAGRIA